jgi:hypothetical protein
MTEWLTWWKSVDVVLIDPNFWGHYGHAEISDGL